MNPLTLEWIEKAEGDFIVAQKIYRSRKNPVYDAVCFHAQQCAEKYLKAFLQENQQQIPRTHKLLDLLKLCQEIDPSLAIIVTDIKELARFTVNIRYPGMDADKDDAKIAFSAVKIIRKTFRQKLEL